jgi:hypothetical protein
MAVNTAFLAKIERLAEPFRPWVKWADRAAGGALAVVAVASLIDSVRSLGHVETTAMFAGMHYLAIAANLGMLALFIAVALHRRWAFVTLTALSLLFGCFLGLLMIPSPYVASELGQDWGILNMMLVMTILGYVYIRTIAWKEFLAHPKVEEVDEEPI